MTHDRLLQLVSQVDGALAVASWPFILWDKIGKSAPAPDLKTKLDLRRDQIFSSIVLAIETTLRPYWPRTASRIILEPEYKEEAAMVLSDDARDALADCIAEHEGLTMRAGIMRGLAHKVSRWDQVCYWCIFITAILALVGLVMWYFYETMGDKTARAAIAVPLAFATLALLAAGIRQIYIHRVNNAIIKED